MNPGVMRPANREEGVNVQQVRASASLVMHLFAQAEALFELASGCQDKERRSQLPVSHHPFAKRGALRSEARLFHLTSMNFGGIG